MIENKKIFVLGMARSGYNVAKLLAGKNEIVVVDSQSQDEEKVQELKNLNVKVIITDSPLEIFDDSFDLIIKNPGISQSHEVLVKAKEAGILVFNEMEVAFHYLPKDITIIGITGSNGKTTTTTIAYELLKKHNLPVVLGGNIGYPLSEVVPMVKKGDILLLEISDHQLVNFKDFKTNISVLTNVCETHLDFHGSYENYKIAKKKIFLNHTSKDLAIINFQNSDALELAKDIVSQKIYFGKDNAYIKDRAIYIENKKIIDLDDILVRGMHNYENIMAALLILNQFKIDKNIVKEVLSTFKGVEHRIEFVREYQKIKFYNDSKATNPTSTVVALNSFDENIHLILGGMERSQDFHELDGSISKVKCIYAIGQVTNRVYEYAQNMQIKCQKCYTLQNAMMAIKENVKEKDIVLLSPASASWDQYPKFEIRGNEFKNYCINLFK